MDTPISHESLIYYIDKGGKLHLIDSENLDKTNEKLNLDLHPVLYVVMEILKAGYTGIFVDEFILKNGKYFQAINVDLASPEGRIVKKLIRDFDDTKQLPEATEILEQIKKSYGTVFTPSECFKKTVLIMSPAQRPKDPGAPLSPSQRPKLYKSPRERGGR